jgi:hypothetical protein
VRVLPDSHNQGSERQDTSRTGACQRWAFRGAFRAGFWPGSSPSAENFGGCSFAVVCKISMSIDQ